mmetsp:Transcript_44242/g.102181  ORF Transcript_44242/g.102181 Transcript_44242/m.102181 type:complete len:232 (+) Transcript_44242:220-915(+)
MRTSQSCSCHARGCGCRCACCQRPRWQPQRRAAFGRGCCRAALGQRCAEVQPPRYLNALVLLVVALLLQVGREALEVQHQDPGSQRKLLVQVCSSCAANFALGLQQLLRKVGVQHGTQGAAVTAWAPEVQREVTKPLHHLALVLALHTHEPLLHLRVQVRLRGQRRGILGSIWCVLQPTASCSQQLIVQLVHKLQQKLVRVLLLPAPEHRGGQGHLLAQASGAHRPSGCGR